MTMPVSVTRSLIPMCKQCGSRPTRSCSLCGGTGYYHCCAICQRDSIREGDAEVIASTVGVDWRLCDRAECLRDVLVAVMPVDVSDRQPEEDAA